MTSPGRYLEWASYACHRCRPQFTCCLLTRMACHAELHLHIHLHHTNVLSWSLPSSISARRRAWTLALLSGLVCAITDSLPWPGTWILDFVGNEARLIVLMAGLIMFSCWPAHPGHSYIGSSLRPGSGLGSHTHGKSQQR